ncbi:unnamed protein product [Rotaria sordida]|uniref:Phosphatidate phosphatase APP1 catalytic domain-containing protein n=1 Tax=Rotaria sordida TaxID=392033 RepID=A0A815NE91_9BILA|nr:unnamed protein product [Rotaria sordida]CAF1137774.1 unnamed protein product [Rotaria sordida]CAF1438293.1 unnamed protein product [Rotaria sordida]CAF1635018.1 unnamed protein product [Rotaria sordida]CAF3565638.1 unnamed protein product [Rotaria sordida]
MWKCINVFILLFLLEKCALTYHFLISSETELILVPSVAFRYHSPTMELTALAQPSDDWILYAQGWLFRENPFRSILATSALSTAVGDAEEKRVSYFTASGKRNTPLCIEGLKREMCAKTDKDGLIIKQFKLSNDDIEQFRIPGGSGGKVEYSASTFDKTIQTRGEIFLCDDNGISIISDIDDTVKITGVTSIRSILRNTFSGEYRAVSGMSERYRHYESLYNATFHYLTASPDQLYPFLREFFEREQFPLGSYHMRHFTWLDSNFFQFFSSKSFIKQKTKILYMFFQETRSRQFILFGDVFQKDPEIYANIYEKYPDRILKIFIRVAKKNKSNRLNKVFKNIPKNKWATFVDGYDLPETIF